MSKINSLVMALCLGLTIGAASAEDGGAFPGYVGSPNSSGSNSIVKTQYGECVKDANYQSSYQQAQCGGAVAKQQPKSIVKKVSFSESSSQLFGFNSPVLTVAGQQELTALLAKAKESGAIDEIDVKGYTDTIGGDDYNLCLSNDRANAVKDFFMSQGVDGDTITAVGMGSSNAQVSEACIQKFGKDDMNKIDRVTAEEKTASVAAKKRMNAELAKFEKTHSELVGCTAPDRRIEITIAQSKEVTE